MFQWLWERIEHKHKWAIGLVDFPESAGYFLFCKRCDVWYREPGKSKTKYFDEIEDARKLKEHLNKKEEFYWRGGE